MSAPKKNVKMSFLTNIIFQLQGLPIKKASKDLANTTIEMKFSENKPLDMRKELANDSEEISKLQEKINDLLKLKDQAKDINNNLRTNK